MLHDFLAYTDHSYHFAMLRHMLDRGDRFIAPSLIARNADTHEYLAQSYWRDTYEAVYRKPDIARLSGQDYHRYSVAVWVHDRASSIVHSRFLYATRRLP